MEIEDKISATSNLSTICLSRAAFSGETVSVCIFTKLSICSEVASGMNSDENAFTNGLSALPHPALMSPKMMSSSTSPGGLPLRARPSAKPPYYANPLTPSGYRSAKWIATGTAWDAARIGKQSSLFASATAFKSSANGSRSAPSRSRDEKPVPRWSNR